MDRNRTSLAEMIGQRNREFQFSLQMDCELVTQLQRNDHSLNSLFSSTDKYRNTRHFLQCVHKFNLPSLMQNCFCFVFVQSLGLKIGTLLQVPVSPNYPKHFCQNLASWKGFHLLSTVQDNLRFPARNNARRLKMGRYATLQLPQKIVCSIMFLCFAPLSKA